MIRFPFFYTSAVLGVVGIIAISVWPLRPQAYGAVEARAQGGELIIDGSALSSIRPANGFAVTPFPGPRGDQVGPRLASFSALAPDAKYSKGARLVLGPSTIAALKGRAFTVTIVARGLPKSPAKTMGLGLVTGGPIAWGQNQVSESFTPIQFEIPASDAMISGLAIWPSTEGQGKGIEIKSISLRPV